MKGKEAQVRECARCGATRTDNVDSDICGSCDDDLRVENEILQEERLIRDAEEDGIYNTREKEAYKSQDEIENFSSFLSHYFLGARDVVVPLGTVVKELQALIHKLGYRKPPEIDEGLLLSPAEIQAVEGKYPIESCATHEVVDALLKAQLVKACKLDRPELKQIIEFAEKVARAMDDLRSSHVFFVLQQAYGDIDWEQAQGILNRVIKNTPVALIPAVEILQALEGLGYRKPLVDEGLLLTSEEAKDEVLKYHCSPETTRRDIVITDVEWTLLKAQLAKALQQRLDRPKSREEIVIEKIAADEEITIEEAADLWARWKKELERNPEHFGDCTNEPQTCNRCLIEDYYWQALKEEEVKE